MDKPDFDRDIDAFWSEVRKLSEWACFGFACSIMTVIIILLLSWGLQAKADQICNRSGDAVICTDLTSRYSGQTYTDPYNQAVDSLLPGFYAGLAIRRAPAYQPYEAPVPQFVPDPETWRSYFECCKG